MNESGGLYVERSKYRNSRADAASKDDRVGDHEKLQPCLCPLQGMGEKYSKFRGKGRVTFDDESIIIEGKRIYHPAILRGLIVLLIVLASDAIIKIRLWSWSLLLVSYYLIQYVILKKEILSLSWDRINKYEIDTQKMMIAFDLENSSRCSPIVFTAEKFNDIAKILREKLRDRERTSHGWTAIEQRYDEKMESMSKSVDKWFGGKRRS